MLLNSWLSALKQSPRRRRRKSAARKARIGQQRTVSVEALETRILLSAGDLDPGFGTGGVITTDIIGASDTASSVAIQSDGKIVVAGTQRPNGAPTFAVSRYNTDGSLDTSFDGDGKQTTNFGTYNYANGMALQGDGKIVVVGTNDYGSHQDFAVSRYNADGSLDSSFDGDGKVVTNIKTYESGNGVALQSDGKIVVVGKTTYGGGVDYYAFGMIRYNTDGTLDTSFGGTGKFYTAFADQSYANSVTVQPDGKIVTVGNTFAQSKLQLARYNADGSLDSSFDVDGKVTTDFGASSEAAYSVAVQGDGKIVIAGYSYNGSDNDFAVARYNTNGTLDTSFDGDGKVVTDFGSTNDVGKSVAIQSDGKLVVTGYSGNEFALARYNADGSLDTSFDGDGKLTTAIGSGAFGSSVALQTDGKIVVAGSTDTGSGNQFTQYDFAVARYSINVTPGGTTSLTVDGSGNLVITDSDGGDSNDELTISHNSATGEYTVTDVGGLMLDSSAIAGSIGHGTASVTFSDAGITGLVVNTLGGDDTVVVANLSTGLTGGLVVVDGTGTDSIIVNGSIDVGSGRIDLNTDAATLNADLRSMGGNVSLTATLGITLTAGADVSTSGAGTVSFSTERTIILASGSSITTVDGDLTVSANQQAVATSGNFVGVDVSGLIQATGAGAVTVDGRGGDAFGATGYVYQYGVRVQAGGDIIGGTSGLLAVTGTGGDTLNGHGSGGVIVADSGSTITSSGSDVSVSGTGGGRGFSSANIGVTVKTGGQITSGGGGSVDVSGQGGNTAAPTAGSSNVGTLVLVNSMITSGGGDVTVNGIGGGGPGGGSGSHGTVVNQGVITAGGTGAVNVSGQASITHNDVYVINPGATITSGGGDITVTGTGTGGQVSVRLESNGNITTAANGGDITVIGDRMILDGAWERASTPERTPSPCVRAPTAN
ncbi:MAG: hypothetical protein GY903_19940 [Fuerstiella sp.]|nr:hypothetical protein [Fuerstiella sp.]MCP4856760.1 hypothetical protein [Fuerstiella sp.]